MPRFGGLLCRPRWLVALGSGLGLLALAWGALAAGAQSPPAEVAVHVPPPARVLEADGTITATVVLTGQEIYGYQLVLTFDPALLEAQAAGLDGSLVRPDFSPPGWSASIDNVAGTVRLAATQFKPAPPATGSGPIAWVRFAGLSAPMLPAEALVGISDPRLAARDGSRTIPATTAGVIRVEPAATIGGRVHLPGRTDESGATVSALPLGVNALSDAAGAYSLTLPVGAYTVTVEMPRYLDAERRLNAVRGANPLPDVELAAGDLNDDDVVDILDLGMLGGMYGLSVDPRAEPADINADGIVDILDLGLLAGNYGLSSPVPWP